MIGRAGVLLLALSASAAPAPVLVVDGDVERPLRLSEADVARLPRASVQAKGHDGETALFEGVPLSEILRAAGAQQGQELRGPALARVVVVEAVDGYRVVFALPELDPAFTDEVVLLADRRDGRSLSESEGAWRIVVPREKRQARWARRVVRLRVLKVPD